MHVGCKTISFSTTISEMTYNTRTLSPSSSAFHRDADMMNALQGHITDLRFVYTGTRRRAALRGAARRRNTRRVNEPLDLKY